MPSIINYDKYENMSKRSLFSALLNAEKKYSTIKENFEAKLNNQEQLINYLKIKIKTKIDEPIHYNLSEAPIIKKLDEEFKKLSNKEQEKIIKEVKFEMYGE